MNYVIINSILYIGTLFIYLLKRRKLDGGFIILFTYSIVAIIGLALYASEPSDWNLKLWPFIYLFVICMLYFRIFLFDSDKLFERLKKPNLKVLSAFSFIYIICSLISIYYGWGSAVENIVSDSLSDAYVENSSGNVVLYTSQFERIVKIFSQYFQPVALITVFYFLTLKNIKPLKVTLLSLAVILPTIVSSILIGNRSMIVKFLILVIISYIIFHKGIPQKRKKIIMIPIVAFMIIIFLLLTIVTVSRFGEDQGAISVFSYLGHSMLTFNYGLTDSIQSYTNGKFFFSWFIDLIGGNSIIDTYKLGGHFEGAFTTFVGAMYMDFGPIGTIMISLISPFFLKLFFWPKKQIDMANIYMYTFCLNHFTYGVFTVSYGSSIIWIMALIVFGILKLFK